LLQNPYNTVHCTLSMLPHYLGKLEVQICCVSKSAPFQIESQRSYHHHHNRFTAFFSGTTRVSRCQKRTSGLWCKGRLTEADTLTIRLGATPSGLISTHLHHPPYFLQAGCLSCRPTNSVKALKATRTFGLGRRR